MRQIKFRTWGGERMYYPPKASGRGTIYTMQGTGLKDLNGTDIYEGDILRDDCNRVLECVWRKCGFCFKAISPTNFTYAYDITQWFEPGMTYPQVIGNIHEPPEESLP